MKVPPFKLEEFWKEFEFTTPHLLCPSDAEPWTMGEILSMADDEALGLWNGLRLSYTETSGLPLLRKEIASLYETVDMEHILTHAGAEEGIYCVIRTLLTAGDHVIVVDPCYQSLKTIPELAGAEISRVTLDPTQGWKLDVDALEAAFKPNTKMLIINYPHNPTGALLDRATLDKMISLARKNGCYIFVDEVYRYLEINEADRLPSIVDAYEKGITLNVMTKSFGLAGLRIGWIASQDKTLIQQVGAYKLYLSICNSAPSEILALIALRARDRILIRNREIMLRNLDLLEQFMVRNRDLLAWVKPKSGTTAFIKLLSPISVDVLTERLTKAAGVLIMPDRVFDYSGNYFRIGFGHKNMPEVLARFEQFLRSIDMDALTS